VQVREPISQSVVSTCPRRIVSAFDDEVLKIAVGAARIKRAEILARAVVNVDSVLTDADARARGMLCPSDDGDVGLYDVSLVSID
jgi:hypothetical protein